MATYIVAKCNGLGIVKILDMWQPYAATHPKWYKSMDEGSETRRFNKTNKNLPRNPVPKPWKVINLLISCQLKHSTYYKC